MDSKTSGRSRKDIEQHIAELERENEYLRDRAHHYHSIFMNSKVAIWEEDFSEVFKALKNLPINTRSELKTYFDQRPEKVFELLAKAEVRDVNPATISMFEADSKEQMLGSIGKILPRKAFPFLRDELLSLAAGETFFEGETVNHTFKGKELHLLITISVIPDSDAPQNVLVNMMDISDRKEREHERARYLEEVQNKRIFSETMQEITIALSTKVRRGELLESILDQLHHIIDFSTASIMMLEGDTLKVERCIGYSDEKVRRYVESFTPKVNEIPLTQKIFETKQPLMIRDVREHPDWTTYGPTSYIRSVLQLPIYIQNTVYGLLSIEHSEPEAFSTEDLQKMIPFTHIAALAVKKSELYERINAELEEKRRTKEELAASLEQKETLLREIHHRVKNNLAMVNSLINLQSYQYQDKNVHALLTHLRRKILSISLVHEKLYRSNDIQNVNFSEYARELLDSLSLTITEEADVHIKNSIDTGIVLDTNTVIPLGLILTELFTNSAKYAHLHRESPLEFSVEANVENGMIQLLVQDNGPGFPEEVELDSFDSLGLTLVDSLSKQIGGSATLVDPGRAMILISFPLEQ